MSADEDAEGRDPWYPVICLGAIVIAGVAFRFAPLPVALVILVLLMAVVIWGEGRVDRR